MSILHNQLQLDTNALSRIERLNKQYNVSLIDAVPEIMLKFGTSKSNLEYRFEDMLDSNIRDFELVSKIFKINEESLFDTQFIHITSLNPDAMRQAIDKYHTLGNKSVQELYYMIFYHYDDVFSDDQSSDSIPQSKLDELFELTFDRETLKFYDQLIKRNLNFQHLINECFCFLDYLGFNTRQAYEAMLDSLDSDQFAAFDACLMKEAELLAIYFEYIVTHNEGLVDLITRYIDRQAYSRVMLHAHYRVIECLNSLYKQ